MHAVVARFRCGTAIHTLVRSQVVRIRAYAGLMRFAEGRAMVLAHSA